MEEYWKISDITGKRYNLFQIIRILNVKQAAYYSASGLDLLHIECSSDRKTGEPVYVFYFNREDTKDVYDKWCKKKQEV